MKKIDLFLLTILVVLIGISGPKLFAALSNQNVTIEDAPRISLEDAKKDFDAGAAVFVDSRSEEAYKDNHIKGAINIPIMNAETRWKEIPTNKKIIVYCS